MLLAAITSSQDCARLVPSGKLGGFQESELTWRTGTQWWQATAPSQTASAAALQQYMMGTTGPRLPSSAAAGGQPPPVSLRYASTHL